MVNIGKYNITGVFGDFNAPVEYVSLYHTYRRTTMQIKFWTAF